MTRRRTGLLPVVCATLLGSLGAHASATQGVDTTARQRLDQARIAFEAGRSGASSAVDKAQQQFHQLLSEEPANPLYLAYYGSTFALQAREVTLPWTKIHLVNHGVELLDRALSLLHTAEGSQRTVDPTLLLETRLVAIATYIALPDTLFHRMAVAKRTLGEAMASPAFPEASADLRGHLIYEGALIAREEHDSAAERRALNQVMTLAPPSIDAAVLRERLAQLP